jgi:hypothetical protein
MDIEKRPPTPSDEEMMPSVKHELKHSPRPRRRWFPLLHCAVLCLIVLLYMIFDFTGSRRDHIDGLRSWITKDHDHHDHHSGQQNRFEKLFLYAISPLHQRQFTNYYSVLYLILKSPWLLPGSMLQSPIWLEAQKTMIVPKQYWRSFKPSST